MVAGRPRMPGRLAQRHEIKVKLRKAGLNTVCEQAQCPNICQCFGKRTATFLILGKVCTRACRFCAIAKNRQPEAIDPEEPLRLARSVVDLELAHAVITSVTRDDLVDGGAEMFAACIREIRTLKPETSVEVLVPDFAGRHHSLDAVLRAEPDVLNHNVETVPRLVDRIRPGASMSRSLGLLQRAATRSQSVIKSGLMVGLGESDEEVDDLLRELARKGCHVVTIGQYLQPSRQQLDVVRIVEEDSYERWRSLGGQLGLSIEAGPLVRSSYNAKEVLDAIRLANAKRSG